MAVKTFTQGEKLTAADTNLYLRNGVIAVFNETQAAGTQGGSSTTAGWTKRTLNTTLTNQISGCSISSSVITLPAGIYSILAFSPFMNATNTKLRLRNTSDSTTPLVGISNYSSTSTGTIAVLQGIFTITSSKNFEVQYLVSAAQATYGLGIATGSENEIYSTIFIQQVGA